MSQRRRTRARRELGPRPRTLRSRELAQAVHTQAEPLFDWAMQHGHWGSSPAPERPKTRGDCEDGIRPCPYVACRHHTYLDVKPDGHIRYNFPALEPDQVPHSCSLDVQQGERLTLEVVGDRVNLTRERVRLIQDEAVAKLRASAKGMGDDDDE